MCVNLLFAIRETQVSVPSRHQHTQTMSTIMSPILIRPQKKNIEFSKFLMAIPMDDSLVEDYNRVGLGLTTIYARDTVHKPHASCFFCFDPCGIDTVELPDLCRHFATWMPQARRRKVVATAADGSISSQT